MTLAVYIRQYQSAVRELQQLLHVFASHHVDLMASNTRLADLPRAPGKPKPRKR